MFTPRISVFFFINPTFASFYHRCLSIEKTSRNNTRLIEESIVFGSRIYVIIRKNLQKIRTDSDKGSKRNEARAYKSDGTERQKGRSPFLPPPSMPVSRKNGSKSNRNGNKIVKPYVGRSQERNRSRSRRPRAELEEKRRWPTLAQKNARCTAAGPGSPLGVGFHLRERAGHVGGPVCTDVGTSVSRSAAAQSTGTFGHT